MKKVKELRLAYKGQQNISARGEAEELVDFGWATDVPGLIAVRDPAKKVYQWDLIHEPSGRLIEFCKRREDAQAMAKTIAHLTDWEQPFEVIGHDKGLLRMVRQELAKYHAENLELAEIKPIGKA